MLLTSVIIGISSLVGGIFMTGTIVKITNYWRERRDMERRTRELYMAYVDNIDNNFD